MATAGITMATPVTYYMKFKANQMRCYLYINDIYIYHTEEIARLISLGHGVTEYLKKGSNGITLFVNNNAEYIPKRRLNKAIVKWKLSQWLLMRRGRQRVRL